MLMPFPNGGGDSDRDDTSDDDHDDKWKRFCPYRRRLYALHLDWMTWNI